MKPSAIQSFQLLDECLPLHNRNQQEQSRRIFILFHEGQDAVLSALSRVRVHTAHRLLPGQDLGRGNLLLFRFQFLIINKYIYFPYTILTSLILLKLFILVAIGLNIMHHIISRIILQIFFHVGLTFQHHCTQARN